ncbi:S-layer homology domain-containing protein [Paenibacillus sp. GCM10023252]|uniref:S-layer homology domain-containing protein n=1 Tax=Paenibacillus sp. GCM10023252 TaxID=3252649 RepID=UPI0036206EE4
MLTKKVRGGLASILVLCMFFSSLGLATASAAQSDEHDYVGHWAEAEIDKWIESGLINGYSDGSFKPDHPIKRAELVALINRTYGFTKTGDASFTDVKEGAWYEQDILIAAEQGYVQGYTDGTIRPEKTISRAEAALILVRVLKLDLDKADLSVLKQYTDAADIPSWSRAAIAALSKLGLIKGSEGGLFRSTSPLTRAEGIVLLERASDTPVPTPTPSATPSPSPSATPTATPGPVYTPSPTPPTPAPYELRNVTLSQRDTSTGLLIEHYRLGFLPSTNTAGVDSYLMFYSTSDKAAVSAYLAALSRDDILTGYLTSLTTGANAGKIFRITDLSYADGGANTFRSGQKDLITGVSFVTGQYYAYAATFGADGVLGITAAPTKINVQIPAYPKNVELTGSGTSLANYTVEFDDSGDPAIRNYFVFYSKKGLVSEVEDELSGKSLLEIEQLAADNRGMLVASGSPNYMVTLNADQKELGGTPAGPDEYYAYVAALDNQGIQGISKTEAMMITAPAPAPLVSIGNGPGTGAVLPGGGSSSGSPYNVANSPYLKALRTATGKPVNERPRIAIFTPGDADTVYYNFYDYDGYSLEQEYTDYGFEPVFIPLAVNNYELYANNSYWADVVKSCEAVFLQGGDQARHARQLLNDDGSLSLLAQAIQYVYEQGGVVGGTSAGAHIQSNPVFGFGDSYPSLVYNQTEEVEIGDIPTGSLLDPIDAGNNLSLAGLGLLNENIIYDTHFDARGRLGRLVIGLRDTGAELGIGMDEGTGLLVRNGVGTVVGHNGVYIVNSNGATFNGAGPARYFKASGVKFSYLTAGDQYNFSTKVVTPAAGKVQITSPAGTVYTTNDIFSRNAVKYQSTKTILSLINSTDTSVVTSAQKHAVAGGPEFAVTFSKDASTVGYASPTDGYTTGNSAATTSLAGYKKTTIIDMIMSIAPTPETPPPSAVTIESVLHYSYDDEVYIEFSDELSAGSITQANIILTGNAYYVDTPPYPDYLADTYEVHIRGVDDFEDGDTITLTNIKDSNGKFIPTVTYVKSSGVWVVQ